MQERTDTWGNGSKQRHRFFIKVMCKKTTKCSWKMECILLQKCFEIHAYFNSQCTFFMIFWKSLYMQGSHLFFLHQNKVFFQFCFHKPFEAPLCNMSIWHSHMLTLWKDNWWTTFERIWLTSLHQIRHPNKHQRY